MSDGAPRGRVRSRVWLALALGGALLAAALCLRCAKPEEPASAAPGATFAPTARANATEGAEEPSENAARTPSKHAPAAAGDAEQRPAPEGPQGEAAPPANTVARVMRLTDAHDRDLLAAIERKTGAAPPPAISDLIALRRRGASFDELDAFIRDALAGALVAQLEAKRWLRALRDPSASAQPEAATPLGEGGGKPRVQAPERVAK